MIDVATNLLGEIVEILSSGDWPDTGHYAVARGPVRAVYPGPQGGISVVVENQLDGRPFGALRGFDISFNPVRIVRQCGICGLWDHPSTLEPIRVVDTVIGHEHAACLRSVESADKDASRL